MSARKITPLTSMARFAPSVLSPKGRGRRFPLPLGERVRVRGWLCHGNELSIIFCMICLALVTPTVTAEDEWKGVDETVVEKFAEQAGRPAQDPFINTDQGDLLLFVFLLAGAIGGFVAGYYYRVLFPPRVKPGKEPQNV